MPRARKHGKHRYRGHPIGPPGQWVNTNTGRVIPNEDMPFEALEYARAPLRNLMLDSSGCFVSRPPPDPDWEPGDGLLCSHPFCEEDHALRRDASGARRWLRDMEPALLNTNPAFPHHEGLCAVRRHFAEDPNAAEECTCSRSDDEEDVEEQPDPDAAFASPPPSEPEALDVYPETDNSDDELLDADFPPREPPDYPGLIEPGQHPGTVARQPCLNPLTLLLYSRRELEAMRDAFNIFNGTLADPAVAHIKDNAWSLTDEPDTEGPEAEAAQFAKQLKAAQDAAAARAAGAVEAAKMKELAIKTKETKETLEAAQAPTSGGKREQKDGDMDRDDNPFRA